MDYEDELEEVLWNSLKEKFNILDDFKLFKYLYTRYFIIYKKNKVENPKDFFKYIFKELNIIDFTYKDNELKFSGNENNLNNVLSNWILHYFNDVSNDEIKEITSFALHNTKDLKNSFQYCNYLLFFKLQKLNSLFEVNLKNAPKIEGFRQKNNKNLENKLSFLLDIEDNSTTFIKEHLLEDYLIEHLDLIEEGLIYQSRQYQLDDGKIDILAKDKNDNLVIIELKIKVDKRIIWQCLYYPKELKKIYPNKNIRMITIIPTYPNELKSTLDLFENVEKYSYKITVKNNKIKNLELRKE